jgi:hypothetical protein
VAVEETTVKSAATNVRSLNSNVGDVIFTVSIDNFSTALVDYFFHSVSMSILMSAMHYLSFDISCSTSTPDRQYGFPRLLPSSISLSIFATASPVASPAFNGSPLSSFLRSSSKLRWLLTCLSMYSLCLSLSCCRSATQLSMNPLMFFSVLLYA